MTSYPVNLNIAGKKAVIVGGGAVAEHKVLSLIDASAVVTVIAPAATALLREMAQENRLSLEQRAYKDRMDIAEAFVVFAATDDDQINQRVCLDAHALGKLVCRADSPEGGNFTIPAVLRQGELTISVSTGGKSPAFARVVRDQLATQFQGEYAETLQLLGAIREKLLTQSCDTAYNKKLLNILASRNLPELIRTGATAELDQLFKELLGPDFSLSRLKGDQTTP